MQLMATGGTRETALDLVKPELEEMPDTASTARGPSIFIWNIVPVMIKMVATLLLIVDPASRSLLQHLWQPSC